jgi:hypothetical protein
MKKIVFSLLAIVCISATLLMSIYESLNISKDEAKKCLLLSITSGYLARNGHPDLLTNARQLSDEDKAEGIRQLIQLAHEYSNTDEFKKDYKKWRNEKLNPDSKTKLGLPKFGKIISNKIDNQVDKGENEKKYPQDPTDMIRKRLTDFLAISSTVDFDAALTSARTFVKPEYEKKSSEWKMCYRAGRSVVEAARVEAQKWLDELDGK